MKIRLTFPREYSFRAWLVGKQLLQWSVMRTADIDADAWAEGNIHSICEIDGLGVDPWTVGSETTRIAENTAKLKVCLPAEVLRFELGECGIELANYAELLDYMKEDLHKHQAEARASYLTYLRQILRPMKRVPLWKRLFDKNRAIAIEWDWISVENVDLKGVVIQICGGAVRR
jgi:hypothetical protein